MTWQIVLIVSAIVSLALAVGVYFVTAAILESRKAGVVLAGGGWFISFLIIFLCLKPWAFVDNYELGYVYNSADGQITVLNHTGYIPRTPFFESVHTIDLRPRQVCINVGMGDRDHQSADSPNRRVLNCKLVSFNPAGLMLFLSWHGRGDYDGDRLDDLLKIYAYDPTGAHYPFLNILRELQNDVPSGQSNAPVPLTAPAVTK